MELSLYLGIFFYFQDFPFTVHMSEDESVLDKQVFKDYTGNYLPY